MSVVTRKAQEVVTVDTQVMVCDGPGCKEEVLAKLNEHMPVGWLALHAEAEGHRYSREDTKHFHGMQCLVNWVDREWPAHVG